MTSDAQRFEIVQVMIARDGAVLAAARNSMIDFHAPGLLRGPPSAHRGAILWQRREGGPRRPLGRGSAAGSAAILVATLCRASRQRPPMIGPERRCASLAAPGAPARRQQRSAPRAAVDRGTCKRAAGEQRRALGPFHPGLHARSRLRRQSTPRRTNGRCVQLRLALRPRGPQGARDISPTTAACSRCR
jgi:hypothetical protein